MGPASSDAEQPADGLPAELPAGLPAQPVAGHLCFYFQVSPRGYDERLGVLGEGRWCHEADLTPCGVESVPGLAEVLPPTEVTQMRIGAFSEEDVDCLHGIIGRGDKRSVNSRRCCCLHAARAPR